MRRQSTGIYSVFLLAWHRSGHLFQICTIVSYLGQIIYHYWTNKTIRKTKFILWIVISKDVHCPMTEFDEFELVRRLNSWLYCSISILQSNQCLSIYTLLVCLFLSFSKPIDRVQILCLTSRDLKEGLWMVKIKKKLPPTKFDLHKIFKTHEFF